MDNKLPWVVSVVAIIALAAVSIFFLGKEQVAIQTKESAAAVYNCTQSGGTFANNSCSCEEEYDTATGYCMTAFGIPGGEIGATEQKLQELVMVKNGDKPTETTNTTAPTLSSASKIVAYNCTASGGTFRNNTCACKDATYDTSTGHCTTAMGTTGGEIGEMEKKLQELEMLKNTKTTTTSQSKIVAHNCSITGGIYRNNFCGCKDATYDTATGYCMTEFGIPGGELGEMEKKLQELEMLKNR